MLWWTYLEAECNEGYLDRECFDRSFNVSFRSALILYLLDSKQVNCVINHGYQEKERQWSEVIASHLFRVWQKEYGHDDSQLGQEVGSCIAGNGVHDEKDSDQNPDAREPAGFPVA